MYNELHSFVDLTQEMTITSVALTSVGAVAVGVFLLRKWVSRKWGVCTLKTKLNGKVVIVTGGNVGLGAEAAMDLAKRGATVILACRSWENTKDTLQMIRTKSGNNDVHYLHLDLGSLESVRQFAEDVQVKYPEIHTLVCNAGVWYPMEKEVKTSDGFEAHAGVNHLGHFLLTNLLLDRLALSAPARVVVVSSALSSSGKIDFEEYDHFKEGRQPDPSSKSFAPTGYCDSKMMNVLFAKELSVKASGRGVTTISLCPGLCSTSIFRNSNASFWKIFFAMPILFLFMRSAASGAQNIIQAVLEDEDTLVNGGFYQECKMSAEENAKFDDMSDIGQQLWGISENLTSLNN